MSFSASRVHSLQKAVRVLYTSSDARKSGNIPRCLEPLGTREDPSVYDQRSSCPVLAIPIRGHQLFVHRVTRQAVTYQMPGAKRRLSRAAGPLRVNRALDAWPQRMSSI